MSIEGIEMEYFSALPQTVIKASTKSCPRHAVFHSFLYDDSKQDAATTTSHRKLIGTYQCGYYDTQPSNNVNYFKLFYVAMIMLRG